MRVVRMGTLAAVGLAACAAAVAVGQVGPDKSADLKAEIDISKPKNIILFIGDGMGEQEVTSGRYYGKGATGRLAMDSLKFRGDVTTYNVGPAAAPPYPPNYVPDSAPTAAAWSSGIKTLDGRLGQGPSSGVTVPGRTSRPTWRSRATAACPPATSRPRRSPTRRRPARPRTSPSAAARARTTRAPRARPRPRPPAGSARSPSSRPTPASTSCSAAGAPATSSRSRPAARATSSTTRRRTAATSTWPPRRR